jgi:hypothetical protein
MLSGGEDDGEILRLVGEGGEDLRELMVEEDMANGIEVGDTSCCIVKERESAMRCDLAVPLLCCERQPSVGRWCTDHSGAATSMAAPDRFRLIDPVQPYMSTIHARTSTQHV